MVGRFDKMKLEIHSLNHAKNGNNHQQLKLLSILGKMAEEYPLWMALQARKTV